MLYPCFPLGVKEKRKQEAFPKSGKMNREHNIRNAYTFTY